MKRRIAWIGGLIASVIFTFGILVIEGQNAMADPAAAEPQLAHMVYFTLKDRSQDAIAKLVSDCKTYLSGHPGTKFFAAGTLVPDLTRPVNQIDFDVALHVVFDSRAAHDAYQTHPRHVQFIDANKPNWDRVRVFDSYVE